MRVRPGSRMETREGVEPHGVPEEVECLDPDMAQDQRVLHTVRETVEQDSPFFLHP